MTDEEYEQVLDYVRKNTVLPHEIVRKYHLGVDVIVSGECKGVEFGHGGKAYIRLHHDDYLDLQQRLIAQKTPDL